MDQTNVEHNTNTNDEKVQEKVTRDQIKIVNANNITEWFEDRL